MKSCNISHQIIKSISCHFAGAVQINSVKTLHNFRMIWNLKIRNRRLTVFLYFNIFTVVFADRHTRINDVWNRHHDLCDFFIQFLLFYGQFLQTRSVCRYLFFYFLRLIFLSLSHKSPDLFRKLVSLPTEFICFLLCCPSLCIKLNYLIHQRKLFILKFIFNIFFDQIRILSDKF